MSITGISFSGMQAASARLSASASNIANVASVGADGAAYQPVRAMNVERPGGGVATRFERGGGAVDLTDEMVEQLVARTAFQANAKLLETAHNLESGLIDRLG